MNDIEICWRDMAEAKDLPETESHFLLLPGNDVADFVIVQASLYEGNWYSDFADGNIDYGDRITTAIRWSPIEVRLR